MAEESKWSKTLAALNQPPKGETKPPAVIIPAKAPIPLGKRSSPRWEQKSVLLKDESIERANARLRARGDKTDFSDLMLALLDC